MSEKCRPYNRGEIEAWYDRFRLLEASGIDSPGMGAAGTAAVVFDVGFADRARKPNPTPFEVRVSDCFGQWKDSASDLPTPPLLARIALDLPDADSDRSGFVILPEISNFVGNPSGGWSLSLFQAAASLKEEMGFYVSQGDLTGPKAPGDTANDMSRLVALMRSYLSDDGGQLEKYWNENDIPRARRALGGISLSDWPALPTAITGIPDADALAHLAPLVDMAGDIRDGRFQPKLHAPFTGDEIMWFEMMIDDAVSHRKEIGGMAVVAGRSDAAAYGAQVLVAEDLRARVASGAFTPSENSFFRPLIAQYAAENGDPCQGVLGCAGYAVSEGARIVGDVAGDQLRFAGEHPGDFAVMNAEFLAGAMLSNLATDILLERALRRRCGGRSIDMEAVSRDARSAVRQSGALARLLDPLGRALSWPLRRASHYLGVPYRLARGRILGRQLHLDPFNLYLQNTAGSYSMLSRGGRTFGWAAADVGLYAAMLNHSIHSDSAVLSHIENIAMGGGFHLASAFAENVLWGRGPLLQRAAKEFANNCYPEGPEGPDSAGEPVAQPAGSPASQASASQFSSGVAAAIVGSIVMAGGTAALFLARRNPYGRLAMAGAIALIALVDPELAMAMSAYGITPSEAEFAREVGVGVLPMGIQQQYYLKEMTAFPIQSVLSQMRVKEIE